MDTPTPATRAAEAPPRHPRGLYTLFFTEMWERCSYYGMRAVLTLFLIDSTTGGMGLSVEVATAIYGLCTAGVYLAALPGGWIADRFLGAQRSVWYGGILIAIGDFLMVLPGTKTFYLGLVFIVLGTGLLKPNVSAIVGQLYPEGGARRDAGFSIFYMGINLGAFIAPFICSSLAEKINWRLGFAAPGIGMIFGLLQFRLTKKYLGEAGLHPGHSEGVQQKDRVPLFALLGGIALMLFVTMTGIVKIDPLAVAKYSAYVIASIAVVYFTVAFLFFNLD
jgi:POT family proton-dependent oligopeptide transporter